MTDPHTDFNRAANESLENEITDILRRLTLEEKVWMMSGHEFFDKFQGEDERRFGQRAYKAGGGIERLELPPLYFCDGPRGVRHKLDTTCFPVTMARGATWDRELELQIGEVFGIETRAVGATLSGAVCINVLRHPAWGRAQETYGEDSYLLGEMGAALCRGIQRHNVIATLKHYAANSIENSRFTVDVRMSERVLREVYLPHFKRVIDAGCASVMSAYNKVNGFYCGHNKYLLRDILKEEWGFKGFVHSDWIKGVYGTDAAEAGLDVENPDVICFGDKLVQAVSHGEVSTGAIDDAARRILRTQLTFSRAQDKRNYDETDICCSAHINLAREAAEKSFVLLKNEALLPLDREKPGTIAVIGQLADQVNLGDRGSSNCKPPYATTIFAGLQAHSGPNLSVVQYDGSDPSVAAELAQEADIAIVIAGYTWENEGEFIPGNEALEGLEAGNSMTTRGGDRRTLQLPAADEALIQAVASAQPATLVALMSGSAIIMENWRHLPAAIMKIWYPGMEGGTAFARVVFGEVSPSGKLPFTIPSHEEQLPYFDAFADKIEYGLYHGYTKFDREHEDPAFPFGYGLSYSSFVYSPTLKTSAGQGRLRFQADIRNTGRYAADEVVQFYIGFEQSKVDRPLQLLRGFDRIHLLPGEQRRVSFEIDEQSLKYFDESGNEWTVEDIDYNARICSHSRAGQDMYAIFTLQDLQECTAPPTI